MREKYIRWDGNILDERERQKLERREKDKDGRWEVQIQKRERCRDGRERK